jgi:hypothetical protein
MRIEIDVELSEHVEPENRIETRRFSRDVEMDVPETGEQIELNVAGEPVFVIVTDIVRDEKDGSCRVKVRSDSLTFRSLREDERWNESRVT